MLSSVLLEEMYHTLKDKKGYDEKRYESALRKKNRTMVNTLSVPNIVLESEVEINDACTEIGDAISENAEEEAALLFHGIWPVIKEYVIYNFYRDTDAGIKKPDITEIEAMTENR